MKIESFENEYRFLSNFHECTIPWKGVIFGSVEAAYQASKTDNYEVFQTFANLSPSVSKRWGKAITVRSDWDDIKVNIMHNLLQIKFNMHKDLREKLLATGNTELIEGNWWGDKFWGVCNGIGQNKLGQLLMQIRRELSLE